MRFARPLVFLMALTLASGVATSDIYRDCCTRVGTKEMGDAVLAALK